MEFLNIHDALPTLDNGVYFGIVINPTEEKCLITVSNNSIEKIVFNNLSKMTPGFHNLSKYTIKYLKEQ